MATNNTIKLYDLVLASGVTLSPLDLFGGIGRDPRLRPLAA